MYPPYEHSLLSPFLDRGEEKEAVPIARYTHHTAIRPGFETVS